MSVGHYQLIPTTIKELISNLNQRRPNRNNYSWDLSGIFCVRTGELIHGKWSTKFSYRLAFIIEADSSNPNSLKISRRVDFKDDTWDAQKMLAKPFEEMARPEFENISEATAYVRRDLLEKMTLKQSDGFECLRNSWSLHQFECGIGHHSATSCPTTDS